MSYLVENKTRIICPMCNIVAIKLVRLYADRNCESTQVCCVSCKKKIKNKQNIVKVVRDPNDYRKIEIALSEAAGKRIEVNKI